MTTEKYPTNPSEEQIQEWKDNFKDIYVFTVDEETEEVPDPNYDAKNDPDQIGPQMKTIVVSEGISCYLRPPSRRALSMAQMAGKQGGDVKFNETLLNQCWLGGHPSIKMIDKYFLAIGGQLHELIEVAEGRLEKL